MYVYRYASRHNQTVANEIFQQVRERFSRNEADDEQISSMLIILMSGIIELY